MNCQYDADVINEDTLNAPPFETFSDAWELLIYEAWEE